MSLRGQIQNTRNSLNRAQRLSSASASASDLVYKGVLSRSSVVSFEDLNDQEKIRLFAEYDYLLVEVEAYLAGLQDQFQDVDQGLASSQRFLNDLEDSKSFKL